MLSPLQNVRHQLLLGDESFVDEYRGTAKCEELREVSKAHRRSLAPALSEFQKRYEDRNEAMSRAYATGAYTMEEIGKHFRVHYMTVSRAVRKFEGPE